MADFLLRLEPKKFRRAWSMRAQAELSRRVGDLLARERLAEQ